MGNFLTFFKRFRIDLILQFVLIFSVTFTSGLLGNSERPDVKSEVISFFRYINEKKYEKSYGYFSDSIKRDVPLPEFKEKAKDIKHTKIIFLKVFDEDKYLAKFRLKAHIELIYKGSYFKAVYAGTCDMVYAGNRWKVASVNLRPLEQKELLNKKTIDFGNKK